MISLEPSPAVSIRCMENHSTLIRWIIVYLCFICIIAELILSYGTPYFNEKYVLHSVKLHILIYCSIVVTLVVSQCKICTLRPINILLYLSLVTELTLLTIVYSEHYFIHLNLMITAVFITLVSLYCTVNLSDQIQIITMFLSQTIYFALMMLIYDGPFMPIIQTTSIALMYGFAFMYMNQHVEQYFYRNNPLASSIAQLAGLFRIIFIILEGLSGEYSG